MDLTWLFKGGALLFGLLILFPIVVAPLMFIGMAVAGVANQNPEDGPAAHHPQGKEWRKSEVPVS
jgi:hypothetical protein